MESGRLWGHTAAFALLLVLLGVAREGRRGAGVLAALGFGSAMHLVLDLAWETPAVTWWPLAGWRMPTERDAREGLLGEVPLLPYLLAAEAAGALLLAWALARRRTVPPRTVSPA